MSHPSDLVTRRPLPSFREWLESHTPDTQANDFEAFADLARRTQDMKLEGLPEEQAVFGRMWMGASIAAVELCNMEGVKHQTESGMILAMLPRVFAAAAMYAVASATKPDTNFRTIAKIMTEEFRFAAKESADQLASGTKYES